MIKPEYLLLAFIAGVVLGTLFFGGLWLTVKKAVASKNTALWFLGSSFLRVSMVFIGFYYVGQGNWQRLLICAFGFIAARFIVIRATRSIEQIQIKTPS